MIRISLFFPILLLIPLTALITQVIREYALKRLLDIPNFRSSHSIPTPRGGGLSIVLVCTLGIVICYLVRHISYELLMASFGALGVAAIGFLDDHRPVSVFWRLCVQGISISWALYWLNGLESLSIGGDTYTLGIYGTLLAALMGLWLLNLFNFMDGIDGFAASEAITVTLFAFILVSVIPDKVTMHEYWLVLAAATTGFLMWNWPPAKLFMGDIGSNFIGFLLSIFILGSVQIGVLSLIVWLILLGVFFVDATVTLLIRIVKKERWYEAHRSHAYQHAALCYKSHKKVTFSLWIINSVWLFPLAMCAFLWPNYELLFFTIAYLPLVYLTLQFKAGQSH